MILFNIKYKLVLAVIILFLNIGNSIAQIDFGNSNKDSLDVVKIDKMLTKAMVYADQLKWELAIHYLESALELRDDRKIRDAISETKSKKWDHEVFREKEVLGDSKYSLRDWSGAWVYYTEALRMWEDYEVRERLEKCEQLLLGTAGQFQDKRDGRIYKTVKLANGQIWMAENLKYKMHGSNCYDSWRDNKREERCESEGRLYSWNLSMNACPDGWRLPTQYDFIKLEEWYDVPESLTWRNWHARVWLSYKAKSNFNAEHIGYYNALLAGNSGAAGGFQQRDTRGYYWSSTIGASNPFHIYIRKSGSVIIGDN